MRRAFHKTIILPCLCSMAFYVGVHIVGETEASFSSQVAPEPITISAAFIFPETIKLLEDRADEIADRMHRGYERINTVPVEGSLQELHDSFTEIRSIEQELHQQVTTLQQIYNELSAYYNQTQDKDHTFDYVSEGFRNVDNRLMEVRETIDFQKIETILSSIILQIKELEEKASQENTQAKQHHNSTEFGAEETTNHGATTNLNDNEKAPEQKEKDSQETIQAKQRHENSKSLVEGTSNQEAIKSSNNIEQVTEHAEKNSEKRK
ncbi:DUF4047 domain-containing protein [Rossellomorea sp. BNER]|uniref:DUF4047 domain-containing protein n=1 Tax=Rossellomorea sp. BNER TaxID=2962031 RepID=UPI003AF27933|nr:DUF4047 domain-containing protein [Rossellomorea sp. BNER]